MKRALLWLVYLVGLLAFFEAGARIALSSRTLFGRVEGQSDAAWRLAWVRRHHEDASATRFSFDEWSPTRGWRPKGGVRDLEAFAGQPLTTNSRGLRGAREYDYAKPAGTFRIVVLGDSFTFGEEVGDDDVYSHVLETLLPGVEVLNLGVHGYGHDQMLLYLREEGLRYHPDLVLLGFLSEDMPRNLLSFRDYAKPRFVVEGDRLRQAVVEVPTPEATLASERWRSRLVDVLSMLREAYREHTGGRYREAQQVTLALLDEIRRTSESVGAKPVFVYLPVFGELGKPDLPKTMRERFFFGYCDDRKIESIYLRPYFLPQLKAGAEFHLYGHWGPLEHRLAAEGIASELRGRGLVPAPPAPKE